MIKELGSKRIIDQWKTLTKLNIKHNTNIENLSKEMSKQMSESVRIYKIN